MKRYKLLKDLPMFKAGDEFHINQNGNLVHDDDGVVAYIRSVLKKYPSILTNWFEEIPEEPKTVDDLREGDECWMLDLDLEPSKIEWRGTPYDIRLRELGKIYPTKKELEKQIAWEEAKQILLHDTKGFKPNYEQQGVCVYWYHSGKKLLPSNCIYLDGTIRFSTYEDAKVSIKAHEKEWKTYLGVE